MPTASASVRGTTTSSNTSTAISAAAAQEQTALARLRSEARAAGMLYSSDQDDRAPAPAIRTACCGTSARTRSRPGTSWAPCASAPLQTFSVDVLPDARQIGELEARLVPVYLLQRYQGEALARLIGGGDFDYASSGDVKAGIARAGIKATPAAVQRQALNRLVDSLRAEYLALPAGVLDILTPPAMGHERSREYFATNMESVFDAFSIAEAGAAQTAGFLLDAGAASTASPGSTRATPSSPACRKCCRCCCKRPGSASRCRRRSSAARRSSWPPTGSLADAMLNLLDGGKLHANVAAEVRQRRANWRNGCKRIRAKASPPTAASRRPN
jgi:hypothetical protein